MEKLLTQQGRGHDCINLDEFVVKMRVNHGEHIDLMIRSF